MFTPLEKLRQEDNFEEYKRVVLLDDREIRYYEVAVVMDCPVETVDGAQYALDELQYNLVSYEEEYFRSYVQELEKYVCYDTGVTLSATDHLLTFQTCVSNTPSRRFVIIARETDRVALMEEVQ